MSAPRRPTLPAWLDRVGPGNLAATVVLLWGSVVLVGEQPDAGPAAIVLVPLAVLPLLAVRRYPAGAAVALAAGVLLAQLAAGPLVTCGVVLPTALIMAFQLGSRLLSTRQVAVGGLGLIGVGLGEVLLDPVLGTIAAAVFVFGLGTTLFVGGLMVRSRVRMAVTLRRRTEELARQRDRTAALAVAADRERIGADLESSVRARVAAIADLAAGAHPSAADRVSADPVSVGPVSVDPVSVDPVSVDPLSADRVRQALIDIESEGRAALAQMRSIVGTLREAPTTPPPGLRDLPELVRRATTARVRLRYQGDPRPLPPNVELSAYRIIERLLPGDAEDVPREVQVTIRFGDDALDLSVRRRPDSAPGAAPDPAALFVARARAQVVGGQVTASPSAHRVDARIPVPAGRPA